MSKKAINVTLYSSKGNQEIIDEIKDEYIRGGHNLSFVQPREKFYENLAERLEQFDHISHALKIGDRQTLMHLVQKGTKFGIFSGVDLSFVVSIEYLQIIPLDLGTGNGIQFMAMNDDFKWGIPKKNSPWDKEKEILPFEFDDINTPTDNYYPVKYQGKWGLFFSLKKEMVIEPQYEDSLVISEGLWGVKKDGAWGFVDIFNNNIIPFKYDKISNFCVGYTLVYTNSNTSIILNHIGKETLFKNKKLIDNDYRRKIKVQESYNNGNRYYYVVGPDNDILIPQNKYIYLGTYCEGLLAASLDGKTYGYIDINEEIVIPFQFQLERYPSSFYERTFHWGMSCVKLNNKQYSREHILINHSNKQIFPYTFQCDYLNYKNGYWGPSGWSSIGDRFKRNVIHIYDLIIYNLGKDMSHLIRTDAEIEIEKKRRKHLREMEGPYEWTEEDTWDAMTDGMYGDYPGGDIDYELLGY